MIHNTVKRHLGVLVVLFSFVGSTSFAACYCVKEWIWGGCAVSECYSELSGGGGGAGAGQGYDKVNLKNSCSRRIQAAIRFKDMSGNWVTNGWYALAPGQQVYVANTKNRIYYVYAETIEPDAVRLDWDGTDQHYSIHGSSKQYGFLKRQINISQWGTWTQDFQCNGISRYYAVAVAWNSQGAAAVKSANTVADAQNRAISSCNAIAGTTGACSSGPVIQPSSYACVALARSGNRLFAETRGNLAQAEQAAVQNCEVQNDNCAVVLKSCNQ